jgi:hypothetical protein
MENQDFVYTVTPLYVMLDTLRNFASIRRKGPFVVQLSSGSPGGLMNPR